MDLNPCNHLRTHPFRQPRSRQGREADRLLPLLGATPRVRLVLLTRQQLPGGPALRAAAGDHVLRGDVVRLRAVANHGDRSGYRAVLCVQPEKSKLGLSAVSSRARFSYF